jgi:hypothetical protein
MTHYNSNEIFHREAQLGDIPVVRIESGADQFVVDYVM